MSVSPSFKTISEKLFAEYLCEYQYQWSHEVPIPGRSKVPDFQIERGIANCLCDVKERSPKVAPPGARSFDPINGIRKLIEYGREKFREFADRACVLVVYNNGDCNTRLDPVCIYGAMLGEPGIQFDFDAASGAADPDSGKNVFLPRGGKMVRHYEPFEPYQSTRNLSAIVALSRYRRPNPEFDRAREKECKAAELRADAALTPGQRFAIALTLTRSIPITLGEVTKLTVCTNPLALYPLSDSLFNGPYDERWSIVDGTLTRIYVGASFALDTAVTASGD